jgi:hypothetical protein
VRQETSHGTSDTRDVSHGAQGWPVGRDVSR